jgi:hypothetical protein
MSTITQEEFFHDFRQELLIKAEANAGFSQIEFIQIVADELIEAGVIEDFTPCYYRHPTSGLRVDGYTFDDVALTLFITDFEDREELQSLTQSEVKNIFKRVENFFIASAEKFLAANLEETSQGYGLASDIYKKRDEILKVNFFLISERILSDRVRTLPSNVHNQWTFSYNIWDISRLHRLKISRGAREEIVIDFTKFTENGLPCLPAHLQATTYKSYLIVMPATILANLYEKYGARLLEQNVRSFLQARGNVNKGIRETIIKNPEMFFAYNNGITATARELETTFTPYGEMITSLTDLQIVNGGQTTASLFHTSRKDKASLEKIFVQMKLTVIDEQASEEVVPKISEYANTQNKVNAADFFSNHPFHVRMEEFSRRLWAPAQQGEQRETKWFYERARGQFVDAQNKLTVAQQKHFLAEYPKSQLFNKTDLAKYNNVWDGYVLAVNFGAQKNFAQFAERIGKEWTKNADQFNEDYYKRTIARAIIFRKTEKIVSAQPWYNGGYRANTVAYTIAMLALVCSKHKMFFNFRNVWKNQDISSATQAAIEITSKLVYDEITHPKGTISNITEWCKREACWNGLQAKVDILISLLPEEFFNELVTFEEEQEELKSAVKEQKMVNGIEAQKRVVEIPANTWKKILSEGKRINLFSLKEIGLLETAARIPDRIPSEKQSILLLDILDKAKKEVIDIDL